MPMSRVYSLRTAINLGFTTVVLLFTVVSIWSVANLLRLEERLERATARTLHSAMLSSHMSSALNEALRGLFAYTRGDQIEARRQVAEAEQRFYRALAEAQSSESPQLKPHVDSISTAYLRFTSLLSEVSAIDAYDRASTDSALVGFFSTRVAEATGAVATAIERYEAAAHNRGGVELGGIETSTRLVAYVVIIGTALLLLFSLAAGWKVTRTVLVPINQLIEGVQKIAVGDFDQRLEIPGARLELTKLVEQFNEMASRLREYRAMNIGRLVEEKRRFEQIVSDLSDVIIGTDRNGVVQYFNRQAEKVLGLPAALVVGRRAGELPQENAVVSRISGDIDAQAEVENDESIRVQVGGSEHAFSYELRRLVDEEGRWIGYLARLHDVTRFRQVDEIRRKMISTVSHELRTPLTSMGMSLELLQEAGSIDAFTPIQRELLLNIQEDVRRLQSFVNDLLDLSRIEQGRGTLRITPTTPRELSDGAVRQLLPVASRQEIQIDVTGVPASLPAVAVDPNRVRQVFTNLLTNAIRYTPMRGTISITAEQFDGSVVFGIRDNGPGIAADETERVFDRFYQIRDDQRAGGSGLGLAIVKEVVEAHGGRVWVESAVGRGSTFYFTLPLATIAELNGAHEHSAPSATVQSQRGAS
jgi:two-component system, NtrC family, sensor histidine kinase KinB